jgi:hypothetical protein
MVESMTAQQGQIFDPRHSDCFSSAVRNVNAKENRGGTALLALAERYNMIRWGKAFWTPCRCCHVEVWTRDVDGKSSANLLQHGGELAQLFAVCCMMAR